VTVVAEGINAALVVPVVLIVSSPPPSVVTLEWGAAAGVSGVGGVMALYMGFRHAAFSVASPVSAVAAAGLSVLVGLLSGERPGCAVAGGDAVDDTGDRRTVGERSASGCGSAGQERFDHGLT
jgi:hypothetical protein